MNNSITKTNVVHASIRKYPHAMRLISIGEVPLNEVREAFGKNHNRLCGVMITGVQDFMATINNGDYMPEHFPPPVATELPEGDPRRLNEDGEDQYRYELVAGHHRYHAHIGTGQTEFYVQVVEFLPAEGVSAAQWRLIYQAQENTPTRKSYVRNLSTNADLASTVLAVLDDMGISNAVDVEKSIPSVLERIDIPAKNRKQVTNIVLKGLGKVASVVQALSESRKENLIRTHAQTVKTNLEHVIYAGFVPNSPYSHDIRSIHAIWNAIETDPSCVPKLHVAGCITKATSGEVEEIRLKKRTLLKDHSNEVLEHAAWLLGVPKATLMKLKKGNNLENFNNIPIGWMPQLNKEDEVFAFTEELIPVNEA